MIEAMPDKVKRIAKAQAPLAVVGALAMIALARGGGGGGDGAAAPSSPAPIASGAPKPQPPAAIATDFSVRSCGAGSILQGSPAKGTVMIDGAWKRDTCTIAIGQVVKECKARDVASGRELAVTYSSDRARIVIAGVHGGDSFAYDCR